MKVETKKLEPPFAPVQLVITLESAKELECMRAMGRASVRIPHMLVKGGADYADYEMRNQPGAFKRLSEMLDEIHTALGIC